tara:strand:+ start:187 stop:435 length:249 start_codon:yes stop_codon:yes gene_type:complete
MQINLQITHEDNTQKTVSAGASDLVAFETKFDLSVAKLEKEVKLTHLLYIAWHSEKRSKATALDFDAWVETVAKIEATEAKK